MQINYILLGQRIRAFRTKKGITQMELAERIDRSAAYMSYVEKAYKFLQSRHPGEGSKRTECLYR